MRNVIVVCGNMQHGKDTFAQFLSVSARLSATRAYSDPLKEILSKLLGRPLEMFYTQRGKQTEAYGHTLRWWLQQFGTEYGRTHVHADVWVHRMADFVRNTGAQVSHAVEPWQRQYHPQVPAETIVISDGRFKNEVEVLRELTADCAIVRSVRVVRPDMPVDLSHRSESEIHAMSDAEFDAVVKNEGSLDDLRSKAVEILQQFGVSL